MSSWCMLHSLQLVLWYLATAFMFKVNIFKWHNYAHEQRKTRLKLLKSVFEI